MKIVLSPGETAEGTLAKLGSEMRRVDFEVTATRAELVKHRGFFRPSAVQSLLNNIEVVLTWTANFFDPSGIRVSATEIQIPEAGEYALSTSIGFSANATNSRRVRILSRELGILSETMVRPPASGLTYVSTSVACVPLNKRDIITVAVWQNSGGTRTTDLASSHFSIARI